MGLLAKLKKLAAYGSRGQRLARLQHQRRLPWFKDQGDKTLRLDYPLTADDVVFDLGGYEGAWAFDIYARYKCRVYVFEPYLPFYHNIRDRFANTPAVQVFPFGLAEETRQQTLEISDDGSSLFTQKGGRQEIIQLEEAAGFLARMNIGEISLLKINIEGGEYDLLDHLLSRGLVQNIKNIQVQFHDFIFPDARARMNKIQTELAKTHRLTWQYEFVWENWLRK